MKKKYVALLACIVCMITVATAEDEAKSKARLYDAGVAGVTTYAFDGFDFEGYKASKHGLDNIIKAEHKSIKDVEEEHPDKKGKFAVVGHSQGGLRALAFATYLQNNDAARLNNLQAVVTVSGIDQGIKALDGGLPAANAKIRRDAAILTEGVCGVVTNPVLTQVLLDVLAIFSISKINDLKNMWPEIWDFITKFHRMFGAWIHPALKASTPGKAQKILADYGEIRDMIPRSNFIQQNVIESKPYPYQVQTGITWHLGWEQVTNRWGWKYWALRWQKSPVYSTYIGYEHTSKLPESIPMGYIAGTKSNVLSIAGSKEQDIRKVLKAAGGVFAAAEAVHIAKCVGIVGLFTGSPRYAAACVKAREYCWNFDSRVNDLLGSSEHDGLVAKESQYIPKSVHGKVLGRTAQGYTTFNYNHAEIFNYNDTKMPPPDVQSKITQMIREGKSMREKP